MPFGIDLDLQKLKLKNESPAAKYVNTVIDKVDAILKNLEKPKTGTQPPTTPPTDTKTGG
jgi:hypothetical protein